MMLTRLFLVIVSAAVASTFTGDDKFIKKYAMMKVYESCFGPEVVREVRKEMKAASAKCVGLPPPESHHQPSNKISPPYLDHHDHHDHLDHHSQAVDQTASGDQNRVVGVEPHTAALHSEHSGSQSTHAGHHSSQHGGHQHDTASLHTPHEPPSKHAPIDLEKLQQAIMSGYNKHVTQQNSALQSGGFLQQMSPQQQYRPYYQQPVHQQQAYSSGGYNQPYYNQQPYYNPAPQPYYNPPQPYYNPPQPYYQPPVHTPYQQPQPYYSQRASRDLDVRGQLETLTSQMAGRVRNVTCVMQELGYLDMNLEPDYTRMLDRISRLPVAEELKRDMAEGVEFCKKFSECVPDDSKDKLVRELVRPMFFFRCYKHKKLEACIMKDVRERYSSSSDEMTEDNLTVGRSAKGIPDDRMESAVYEFLYGGDSQDLDSLF